MLDIERLAEYLREVKMLPRETQLRGLFKRWPKITAEEFESAVIMYNARDLAEEEKQILELRQRKHHLESLGYVSPVGKELDDLSEEHQRLYEMRTGKKKHGSTISPFIQIIR